MEANKAELIGRINYKDIKETTNTKVVKFLVSRKIRDNEYVSFPVTMFGDDGVKAYQSVEKGDYGHFIGRLTISSFVKDDKKIDKMEFIATSGEKVEYDTDKKDYVPAKEEAMPWRS